MIAFYAEKKEMLPRSINDIYENIQEYVILRQLINLILNLENKSLI